MRLIRGIVRFFDRKIILPVTKFFVNIGKKIKKINKPLESLLKTKSSLIVVSLLLAIVIFLIVDSKSTTLLETDAEVLYNQKVTANYNDEEYVVTGLPKTVDITMIGTKANLYLAKQLPEQPVTVDLSNLSPGVHEVKLKYKQAITSVEYKLDPSTVTVSIDTKQSITREISSEIVNLDNLDTLKYTEICSCCENPDNSFIYVNPINKGRGKCKICSKYYCSKHINLETNICVNCDQSTPKRDQILDTKLLKLIKKNLDPLDAVSKNLTFNYMKDENSLWVYSKRKNKSITYYLVLDDDETFAHQSGKYVKRGDE